MEEITVNGQTYEWSYNNQELVVNRRNGVQLFKGGFREMTAEMVEEIIGELYWEQRLS